ncbi:C4-dicarboxylate TRAP transporter large permease protein DctM [Meiothermus luteus]|uniref:C4-dicarboxylate TRAP transporter large permease protein DctM n=1 Tax=Meiothermus luteus TaxID=2026184 RepID=A0A399F0M3_9DEIN|nr:C4-dicarboxylate TRAP transporter large permease protein DctM [Meiothermus luteus]
MVKAIGVDPLWFGVYLVLMVELAQITPPVGFNLFVLQSLTGEDLFQIARYALPFMGVLTPHGGPTGGLPGARHLASPHHDGGLAQKCRFLWKPGPQGTRI